MENNIFQPKAKFISYIIPGASIPPMPVMQTPPVAYTGLKVQRGSTSEDLGTEVPQLGPGAEPLVGVWDKAPRSW